MEGVNWERREIALKSKRDLKLIDCVRTYECLYNSHISSYKNIALKKAAWEEISKVLNVPAADCKLHWNQLRNAFLHALSRRKSPGKFFRKWKYESDMTFLKPFMSEKKILIRHIRRSSVHADDHDNTTREIKQDADSLKNFEENHYEDSSQDFHETNYEEQEEFPDLSSEEYTHQNKNHELIEALKEVKKGTKEKDDIDLFFESLAKSVKQLPKVVQIRLKLQLLKTVTEAELKMEEVPEYFIVPNSPQPTT